MRIAVTAENPNLDSAVDPRLGRCPYFVILNSDDMSFDALANPHRDRQGGAGIQVAKLMAERGVQAVLTGSCGPNAVDALNAAQIRFVNGTTGTVRQAVEALLQGQGAGAGNPPPSTISTAPSPETSRGPARSGHGWGRGQRGGGGGGMGRGMGRRGGCPRSRAVG